jgi:hypothetical protein
VERPEVLQLATDQAHAGSVFRSLFPLSPPSNEVFALPETALSCAADPLTMHVSAETCQKIWAGEYVPLGSLLKGEHRLAQANLVVDQTGQIQIKQKPTREIRTIREWTDAFLIYAAILVRGDKVKEGDMFQYMALIREAESRSGSSLAWKIYDENFRMRQAVKPQSWAEINSDLWLRTMMLAVNSQPPSLGPSMPSDRYANNRHTKTCWDFNNARGCSFKNCKFDHVCLACGGPHNQNNCPRFFRAGGQKATNFQKRTNRF